MNKLFDRFTRSVRRRIEIRKARCNICDRLFRSESRFARFCRTCKQDDDTYRFAGWLAGRVAVRQK